MKGNITVHTQNIFPVIKKWLYSDKDIFLREIVSNGCDAITKLKKVGCRCYGSHRRGIRSSRCGG